MTVKDEAGHFFQPLYTRSVPASVLLINLLLFQAGHLNGLKNEVSRQVSGSFPAKILILLEAEPTRDTSSTYSTPL